MRGSGKDLYLDRLRESLSVPRSRRSTRVKLLRSTAALAAVLVGAVFWQFHEQENNPKLREDPQLSVQQSAERTVFGQRPRPVDEVSTEARTVTPAQSRNSARSERSRTAAPADIPQPLSHHVPADVQAFLNRWRTTMIAGDASGQAEMYANRVNKFFTKRNVSRDEVRKEKERMLSRYPDFHKYDISDVRIERLKDDRAVLTFRKQWDARGRGRFSGSEQQRLTLIKQSGSWRIVGEEETKVHWVRRS
jgi:uncharacterized protein (TIGR02246 family)